MEETLDEWPPQTAGYMNRGNACPGHLAILGRNAKPRKDKEFQGNEDVDDTPVAVRAT